MNTLKGLTLNDILAILVLGTLTFFAIGATMIPWYRQHVLRRIIDAEHMSARERLHLANLRNRPVSGALDFVARVKK